MGDSQEQRTTVCKRPVLAIGSKVVTANQTLDAGAHDWDVVMLTDDFPLVDPTVSIPKIRRFCGPFVKSKTFLRQPDSASVVEEPAGCENVGGAQARDDDVERLASVARFIYLGTTADTGIVK